MAGFTWCQVRESGITSVAGSGMAMRDVRLAIMMPTFLNRRSRFLAVAGQPRRGHPASNSQQGARYFRVSLQARQDG